MSTMAYEQGGSLVTRAVQAVRAHIRAHDLKVGDPLPGEGRFAEDLGVSRAVMREAFGALSALKLIDVANGRRARVGALDGSVIATSVDHAVATAQISVFDVWDVRRTVEVRIAALAAERRSDAQARRIVELAAAIRAGAHDQAQTTDADIEFHHVIAAAGGNALFEQIVHSFAPLMDVAVPQAWKTRQTAEEREAILCLHEDIADAILQRDPARAAAGMERHFDKSIGDLLRREQA